MRARQCCCKPLLLRQSHSPVLLPHRSLVSHSLLQPRSLHIQGHCICLLLSVRFTHTGRVRAYNDRTAGDNPSTSTTRRTSRAAGQRWLSPGPVLLFQLDPVSSCGPLPSCESSSIWPFLYHLSTSVWPSLYALVSLALLSGPLSTLYAYFVPHSTIWCVFLSLYPALFPLLT